MSKQPFKQQQPGMELQAASAVCQLRETSCMWSSGDSCLIVHTKHSYSLSKTTSNNTKKSKQVVTANIGGTTWSICQPCKANWCD